MRWSFTVITEADIDPILEIERDSFPKPWSRLSFLNELTCRNTGAYAVKYRDGNGNEQIIGYIYWRLTAGEMHILKIAVAPQWRGLGVASMLMDKSLALASEKNILKVSLEVRPSNHAAINFYHKIGFQIIGMRKNYYPETREDALVMVKNLQPEYGTSYQKTFVIRP